MEPQGWVIIGTKLDNKQLIKDLKTQEKILEEHEKEATALMGYKEGKEKQIKYLEEQLERAKKFEEEYKKINDEFNMLSEKMGELLEGNTEEEVAFNLEANPETVERYNELRDILRDMRIKREEEEDAIKNINEQIKEEEKNLSNVNAQLKKNLQSQQQISSKMNEINTQMKLNNINAEITKASKGMTKIIKKVGTWALGIFGIRSAYMIVRNAISMISQEDEKLANTVNYIKYALATSLKPIIEWIINAVYKLIAIFGGVIKAIFGVNIFAKATASNFAKANSNAGALKKTLAGFDEMNIINESGGSGVLGGLMGDVPDLASQVEEQSNKIKAWFKKGFFTREELQENAETYKNAWIKVGEFLGLGTLFNDFKERFNEFKEQLKPIWQPVIDGFNEMVNIVKTTFKPFTDYIDEHFIKPIKTKFTEWKDGFLSRYAKFINKLIYGANYFLQLFGVQLEYLDEESALTGDDIKENIGGAMKKVKEDSDKTSNSLGTLHQRLKDLTSKTWKFVINLVTSGNINEKLQPLRDALGKIGINLPHIQLAKGGIINMPGRGVPIGSAIAGERGQEGVIPLTDSQQMALLGEAIGKYITMNATVPVYIGNRLVAREMKRIEAEDNFAYNR